MPSTSYKINKINDSLSLVLRVNEHRMVEKGHTHKLNSPVIKGNRRFFAVNILDFSLRRDERVLDNKSNSKGSP